LTLLHELKEIVIKFIRQIKQSDFSKDSDVKLLYEKANEIEHQIVNTDSEDEKNAVNLNYLIEISDNLQKSQAIRVMNMGYPDNTIEQIVQCLRNNDVVVIGYRRKTPTFMYGDIRRRMRYPMRSGKQSKKVSIPIDKSFVLWYNIW